MVRVFQIVVRLKNKEELNYISVAQTPDGILTIPQINSENEFFQIIGVTEDHESVILILHTKIEVDENRVKEAVNTVFKSDDITVSEVVMSGEEGSMKIEEDAHEDDVIAKSNEDNLEGRIISVIKAQNPIDVKVHKSGTKIDEEDLEGYVAFVARIFGTKKELVTKDPPESGDYFSIKIKEDSDLKERLDSTYLFYVLKHMESELGLKNEYLGSVQKSIRLGAVKDFVERSIAKISAASVTSRASVNFAVMTKLSRLNKVLSSLNLEPVFKKVKLGRYK